MMCKAYGLIFCEEMEEKYGTAYIHSSHPIGLFFTEKWLHETARLFGVESQADRLIESEKLEIQEDLLEIKKLLDPPKKVDI